jgi:lambda repressor-like predicted transcriptional regulator
MNKLPLETRVQILSMLCEGSSMRSISRVADVSINTVAKLLVDAGKACATFHDAKVRGVKARRVQVDEIWSFTAAKQKNVATMKKAVQGWSVAATANTPSRLWMTCGIGWLIACSSPATDTRLT